jgi:hypothetical protein
MKEIPVTIDVNSDLLVLLNEKWNPMIPTLDPPLITAKFEHMEYQFLPKQIDGEVLFCLRSIDHNSSNSRAWYITRGLVVLDPLTLQDIKTVEEMVGMFATFFEKTLFDFLEK